MPTNSANLPKLQQTVGTPRLRQTLFSSDASVYEATPTQQAAGTLLPLRMFSEIAASGALESVSAPALTQVIPSNTIPGLALP